MYITLANCYVLLELIEKLALEMGLPLPLQTPYVYVKCPPRPLIWGWVSNSVTEREEDGKTAQDQSPHAFEKVNHLHQMVLLLTQ